MKQGVTIVLDRPRQLRYGINALVRIEELTGRAITQLELEQLAMTDLRIILYAGLCHEDANLTLEQVGDLLDDFGDLPQVAEKLGEALSLAFAPGEAAPGK